ncbi:hypothetical protein ACP275_01G110200 [Erythranthe tilingii]
MTDSNLEVLQTKTRGKFGEWWKTRWASAGKRHTQTTALGRNDGQILTDYARPRLKRRALFDRLPWSTVGGRWCGRFNREGSRLRRRESRWEELGASFLSHVDKTKKKRVNST